MQFDEMLLGIFCGGVWCIIDGVVSWELCVVGMNVDFMLFECWGDQNIQDLYFIVCCVGVFEVLWIQYYCGIWCFMDNGVSWYECKVELFSFGFVVVVYLWDGDIVWFVFVVKDEWCVLVD